MANELVQTNHEILLVEDNPADVRLVTEVLDDPLVNITVAENGEEALAVLRGDAVNQPLWPDLILLDLNMPKLGGLEVLSEIKKDPQLRIIPVVVLTTSQREEDVVKSYDLQASGYIRKPMDLIEFMDLIKAVRDYWLKFTTSPMGYLREGSKLEE
ncbi:response regulator [SAR202 cluster bacterium AC-409-J13_OGT_754m]|nr:response regulator [SAR202 cluster bacterium AC-409-J13_OGT_754m]